MLKLNEYDGISVKTFNELIEKGVAKALRLRDVENLKGKRIIWTHAQAEGNMQQIYQTVVGEIGKDFADRTVLMDVDGTRTGMFLDYEDVFNCSDLDRYVMYITADDLSKAEEIKTLGDLEEYVNEGEDYPGNVELICIYNGWELGRTDTEVAVDKENGEILTMMDNGKFAIRQYN